MAQQDIIKIKPFYYIHVLDGNTNITRLENGPQNFIKQDHEKIVSGNEPQKMVILNPFTYVEVKNPVMREANGDLVFDKYGQVKLRHGDSEIRTSMDYSEPFPLYPGESVAEMDKIITIPRDSAARLECLRDFFDEEAKIARKAGDEWLIYGPALYIPRIEVKLDRVLKPEVIKQLQALKLRARRDCKDSTGEERKAGDYWLIRERGFYIPRIDEDVIEKLNAYIITEGSALHLRANEGFKDIYDRPRKYAEEWLITSDISTWHILDVKNIEIFYINAYNFIKMYYFIIFILI